MLPTIPKKKFEVRSKFLPKGRVELIPFAVGQEQHLIQVKDSEDDREKIVAIKQIIQECVQTPDVNVSKLPFFVIEELFLRLVQNSTGELISLNYLCKNELPTSTEETIDECNHQINLDLDIRDFVLKETEGHTNTIEISPPIGVKFKYPSIELYENGDYDLNDDTDAIIGCIDMIFDDTNVYQAEDHTKDELIAFWNQQTLAQKKEVFEKFFNSMPHQYYKKVIKCPKCGHEHSIEFNSMLEAFS